MRFSQLHFVTQGPRETLAQLHCTLNAEICNCLFRIVKALGNLLINSFAFISFVVCIAYNLSFLSTYLMTAYLVPLSIGRPTHL